MHFKCSWYKAIFKLNVTLLGSLGGIIDIKWISNI